MSVINAVPLLEAAGGGDYTIGKSVRLRSSASAYLNRTPASATNRQIMTFSMWVKLGATTGGTGYLFSANTASGFNDAFGMAFSSGTLDLAGTSGGATVFDLNTTQVFRDPSAWYHIVYSIDTTQATASNRIKLYINGVQVTAFGTATYPPQNTSLQMNNTVATYIGRLGYTSSALFDGYLTEINFIDGQALTPSSFGSTNALTGVWQPAKYTGTYGTNGFYLNFSSNGSSAALGTDFSGNSNTWTVNNISVTAGTTYDSMTDVPTLTSATAANFPTINAVNYNSTYITLSEANLRQTYAGVSAAAASQATMAIPTTGKWYWEVYINATGGGSGERVRVGITDPNDSVFNNTIDNSANHYMQLSDGTKRTGTTNSTYGSAFSATQIIQVLYDATAGSIYFGQNNSFANGSGSFNQTFSTATAAFTGLSGTFIPAFVTYGGADISVNFGQRPFTYTPPTGFVALNTYNLPTSTITNGAAYMAATTWTGTGANASISNAVNGVSMQPDLVWVKARSAAYDNQLTDSVRGVNKELQSNGTAAETNYGTVTAFNSNGFSVGTGASSNQSSITYVGWQWKAGTTSSSNTNGSITSTVSVGATQGFSVVTYTGTGVTATVGHGLGVAPSMIIVKNRSAVESWRVGHSFMNGGSSPWNYYMNLNATSAQAASSSVWNNTAPTSSVFSISNDSAVSGNTNSLVAYCFAAVKGFSAFGSYTGNSSSDGPFLYTGFRPRWLMLKVSAGQTGDWLILDTSRDTYNTASHLLYANTSAAEDYPGGYIVDILSNGFKLRNSSFGFNNTSGTYIWAAFAETPFRNALAR